MRAIGSAVLTAQFDGAALDATLAHFTAAEA
jgi:hypothetical protein